MSGLVAFHTPPRFSGDVGGRYRLGNAMAMDVLAGGVVRRFDGALIASGANRDCYKGQVREAEWVGPLVVKLARARQTGMRPCGSMRRLAKVSGAVWP